MKKYQIIYADPPWEQSKGGIRKVRPSQGKTLDYPTINNRRIKQYFYNFPDAKVLFIWTIDKYLFDCEQMFSDFKLHARFIWDKTNGIAPAFTIRFTHEYLIWYYKKKFLPIAKEMRGHFKDVFREESKKHSRKPDYAYKMVNLMYPNEDRLDVFAREVHQGWDVWGNEAPDKIGGLTKWMTKLK